MDFKRRYLTYCNGQVRKGINDLLPGLISDIIARLPLESILACKLVCKKWYCVTRDPCFIKLQLSRSTSRLILLPRPGKETSFSLDHLPLVDIQDHIPRKIPIERMPWTDFQIMCSYNGLLCISALNGKADPLCVHNPITNERIMLPPSHSKGMLSSYLVSLGFDSSTGRYKIVRFCKFKRVDKNSRFEILSFGESSWRELNAPILGWRACGVEFCNGVFYCQMTRREITDNWSIRIIAVDISNEQLRIIAVPMEVFPTRPFVEMLDLEGSPAFIEHDKSLMKIWRLTGNKVGGFSLRLECTHDTDVRWTKRFYYKTISKLNDNSYLLWVTTWKPVKGDVLTRFSPGMDLLYSYSCVPNLPLCFKALCIKPSFVSPLAAALCL